MIMEPIVVRKAQQADIPAILEIEWECFREDSFSKEQFAYLPPSSHRKFLSNDLSDRQTALLKYCLPGDIPAIVDLEWECFREDSFSK